MPWQALIRETKHRSLEHWRKALSWSADNRFNFEKQLLVLLLSPSKDEYLSMGHQKTMQSEMSFMAHISSFLIGCLTLIFKCKLNLIS